MAATLTTAGWTVDVRGTETLHTRPSPIASTPKPKPKPKPTGEAELVPAGVIDSIHHLVDYNWTDEQLDYDQQDPEDRKDHVAVHLNRIAQHWDLYRTA